MVEAHKRIADALAQGLDQATGEEERDVLLWLVMHSTEDGDGNWISVADRIAIVTEVQRVGRDKTI